MIPMRNEPNRLPREILIWGKAGQAKLVRPVIEHYGSRVVALFDDESGLPALFDDVPEYFGQDELFAWIESRKGHDLGFCLCIMAPRGRKRVEFHRHLVDLKLKPVTVSHPSAIIAQDVDIGPGTLIGAGVNIGQAARLGLSCIVNARAGVDHDNIVGDGSEISPGATLCGEVTLGENVWIGAGATILPGVTVGSDAIVGAGAVVTRDVPEKTTVAGIPAKPLGKI